jgi:hypothetical protein
MNKQINKCKYLVIFYVATSFFLQIDRPNIINLTYPSRNRNHFITVLCLCTHNIKLYFVRVYMYLCIIYYIRRHNTFIILYA